MFPISTWGVLTGTDIYRVARDPNCGAAFDAAMDDTVLGYVRGCSQTNPDVVAKAPATSPVCLLRDRSDA